MSKCYSCIFESYLVNSIDSLILWFDDLDSFSRELRARQLLGGIFGGGRQDEQVAKWPVEQGGAEELQERPRPLAPSPPRLPSKWRDARFLELLNQERRLLLDGKRGVLRIVFIERSNSS